MARPTNKLSALAVKNETRPGRHSDGGGLYLQIGPTGAKSWVYMWKVSGRRTAMGLGAYPVTSLADARLKAEAARKIVSNGGDPLRKARKEAEKEKAEHTFAEAVDAFLADNKAAWRNDKHKAQWEMTLGDAYCKHLRPLKLSEITTTDVLKVLQPIWLIKSETASRLRGRIERVLAYAKGKGWRTGENPALWRDNLDGLLLKRRKLAARGHHAAMPYSDAPAFVGRLQHVEAMAARALEFLILTAGRSGEVLGARWEEIDFEKKLWTVPAERMKAGEEHEVPLSPRAVVLLKELVETRQNDFLFPGQRRNRPLSGSSMEMLLRRLKVKDRAVTCHGFRSTFRDWAGDRTSFERDVAEMALAHAVQGVEAAYRRGRALEKRRKLMQAWADYLASGDVKGKVITFVGRRKASE